MPRPKTSAEAIARIRARKAAMAAKGRTVDLVPEPEPEPLTFAQSIATYGDEHKRISNGKVDLSDWTMDELKFGARAPAGMNRPIGRPPATIPKQIHDEYVRRTLSKARMMLQENVEDACRVLVGIAKSNAVEPKDRLRAVGMILDRVMGKAPEKIEITGDAPWMTALQAAIVSVPALESGVVDAEVIEDEDEDD